MKKTILLLVLSFLTVLIYGQKKKTYFPVWTFHQKNTNIYGASVELWSERSRPRHTNTNGIRLELIGVEALVPRVPASPIAENDSVFQQFQKDTISERISGFNLSGTGTVCDCVVNGISAGLIGQIVYKVNGISITAMMNFAQIHNGIQIAMFNESYRMNGLQIGFSNKSKETRGIQIGLWNVNERRKLPLINWNFRK